MLPIQREGTYIKMPEKIYTIRITEAMKEKDGCPICRIRAAVETDEITRILGAAMMEPDVRNQTNKKGFCGAHYQKLLEHGNRLSLALMMGTHLSERFQDTYVKSRTLKKTTDAKKLASSLRAQNKTCYLCERIRDYMDHCLDAFIYMFAHNEDFAEVIKEQPYFCDEDTAFLMEMAQKKLSKAKGSEFASLISDINAQYYQTIMEDIDWFCKKFDYRYRNEDWKNSKDAPERLGKLFYSK